jgi:hypothetical protein
MTIRQFTTAAILLAFAGAPSALAQSAIVVNPSFETVGASTTDADGWREFFPARRREVGDGITANVFARTGVASMEMIRGTPFTGFDTNEFNLDTFLFNDVAYEYGCGPAQMKMWYYIPSAAPILIQPGGIKFEVRRANTSQYLAFEDLFIRTVADGQSGHTSDAWVEGQFTVWPAQFDFIHLYNNQGATYGAFPGEAPVMISLLPFRFSDPFLAETGSIWVDDVSYAQDKTGAVFSEYIAWDDQEVSLRLNDQAGVTEPEVPVLFFGDSTVYTDGDQMGFGCLPSADAWKAVRIIDRVPATNEYPETFVDIVANGYVRATFQNVDGTAGTFGSSVITAPSFRRTGQPLDLIPDVSGAEIDMTYNFPPYVPGPGGIGFVPDGPPERSSFTITGDGTYGAFASVSSVRDYSVDPSIGSTEFTVTATFTADQAISLQQLGNDAFRFLTVSSMFANRGTGEYDASSVVVNGTGGTSTVVLQNSTPRNAYLWATPRPIAVGSTFLVVQDDEATFNLTSPTIEVTIDSVSGAAGSLGVQGFLSSSTDPNDDSLSVWLEWTGAPSSIAASSVITATFTVRALPPSAAPTPSGCTGDVNGDGFTNAADFTILAGNFGSSVTPNTGGDLNGDGLVNAGDFVILAGDFGCTP